MSVPPRRILVVDDNAALRENLAECLEGEGYEVAVAHDGPAALARLAEGFLPGAVLLDLMMPGMDGREVAAAIRTDPRYNAVRLVLTTGLPSARARVGVDAVLAKPFGVKELLEALRRVGV
jgi:CheY-like chemotaxis protein